MRSVFSWTKPVRGVIKINVDATVGHSYSVLAVVVRDLRGDLIFACSNKANTYSPLQTKAEALRWAISLADQMNSSAITIEGDCQMCLNVVSKHCQEVSWRIKTITQETIVALESLPNPTVCLVPKKANMAAHTLVRWSLLNNFVGSFNVTNCPPCFSNVIKLEANFLFVI